MKGSQTAFWDSSSLLPLCVRQDETLLSIKYARQYPRMVVWWSTSVECRRGLARIARMGELDQEERLGAVQRLVMLQTSWYEILPSESIRSTAIELLGSFSLAAADSLQLAAALTWCRSKPQERSFVCFHRRLREAAEKVGFSVFT